MATKAQPANRAAICGGCGWTNYPQSVPIPERPGLLEWAASTSCDRCGAELELSHDGES
jgi:hypothetical protein